MILCTCPTCNTRHQFPDELAGKLVKCPCGDTLRVPDAVIKKPTTPAAKKPEPEPELMRPTPPAGSDKKGPKGREPWFYRFIESYAEAALALGSIDCLLGWMLGAAVFVQLGINVFLGIVLSLLSSGVAFIGMVFWCWWCSTPPGVCRN